VSQIVRFGGFEVDLATGDLWRNGRPRERLQEQPLQILAALVARPGELVTRQTLRERLWPDEVFVDYDRGLNKAVQKLRAALGDSAPAPRFIETIPRRGYRFLAPVERSGGVGHGLAAREPEAAAPPAPSEPAPAPYAAAGPRPPVRRIAVLGALAVALVVLIGFVSDRRRAITHAAGGPASLSEGAASPGSSLAVLPFRELAPEEEASTHLGLGMADTLITKLSNLSDLAVRPTSSVFAFAGSDVDALEAGRRLEVDHVLEGSLQRDGGRVRVSVRLLRVADGRPLWAEVLEEEGLGLFDLQDAISARIAAELVPEFSAEERVKLAKRYTGSVEAYRAYVRGRYFFERESPDNLRRALAEFERAVDLDQGFALAWAGITHAWAPLLTWGWAPNAEGLEPAQAAAFRALALDDGLAEVHTAVAIAHSLDWDWKGEEESYRRALAVNPNYPTAYNWLGFLLAAQGRADEALAMQRRAQEIDPIGLLPNVLLGAALHGAGRSREAIAQLERTLELEPDYLWTLDVLADIHWDLGDLSTAEALLKRAGSSASAACLAAEQGKPEGARALLEALQREATSGYVSPYQLAVLHACLGDADRAFAELESAFDQRVSTLMTLSSDRRLAALRPDPRFAGLVRRVGIAQPEAPVLAGR
jgi:TolB-like protein/DNA-binding winged helix-turn-helix (wHTH) protein/Flp pilus assembly protein TadD